MRKSVPLYGNSKTLRLTRREDFKIRQIPQPVVIIRPLSNLYGIILSPLSTAEANFLDECIESKHIILNPDYQREVVWDETRSSNLITSILSKSNLVNMLRAILTFRSGLLHTSRCLQCEAKSNKHRRSEDH